MFSGKFGDHGKRSSRNDLSVSSICFGTSVRKYSKYSYGFKLLAFAVSVILYMTAIIYSITETARANGLNVYYYIRHLLTELPQLIDENGSIEQFMPEPLMP